MKNIYLPLSILSMLIAFEAHCQYQITTLQPPSTLGDTTCAGSVIDIPFTSTGTFDVYNTYYAQLIDSDVITHTAVTYTVGALASNVPYPNPPPAGDISCLIPSRAPAGCHYYVQVTATTPGGTTVLWGPFCIQHCDILTNNQRSVPLECLESCQKQPQGDYDTLTYNIHEYDSLAHYKNGNKFEVQLISFNTYPASFSVVNTGLIGAVADTVSGNLDIHIPCPDTLFANGINPGVYYMRVIADSSNFPDSTLGTLVYLTIGEPADSMYLTLGTPGPFCADEVIYVYTNPDNQSSPYNSTYTWWITDKRNGRQEFDGWNYGYLAFYTNGADTEIISCQEDNYGCLGPLTTLTDTIIIKPALPIPTITYSGTTFFSSALTGNQWFRDDVAIPGETKDTLVTSTPGCYSTVLTDTDGCTSKSDTICIHVTGVQNFIAKNAVSIYPNPNSGSFIIQSSVPGGQWSVEVYNVLGEKVYSNYPIIKLSNYQIDLSGQPNGVYLYRVLDANNEELGIGKFIIQK